MMHPLHMFYYLIAGHFICDFWAQSDSLAKMKNRNREIDLRTLPPRQTWQTIWPYALTAHAVIHGFAVALITGSFFLALFETATHWVIDFGKCESWYGIHMDQFLHLLSKILIVAWAFGWIHL